VTKAGEEILSVSLDIGCVRLTERFLHGDPPTASEVADATRAIGAELDRATEAVPALAEETRARRLVGLAGTVSTLATLELGLAEYDRERIHHAVLTAAAVGRGAEPVAERARRPGLPAGRRDVIFGGALVLREVMTRFAFPECIVSEADILDGLIMSLRLHAEGPADAGRRRAT
jgi:exopolyphosphatase/guanosine-5'-triphosphate,3'-diphosphate pyrophosphatase